MHEFWRGLIERLDIKSILWDGYDTYEDYVKYGDAFVDIGTGSIDTKEAQIETKETQNDVMNS